MLTSLNQTTVFHGEAGELCVPGHFLGSLFGHPLLISIKSQEGTVFINSKEDE